MDQLSTNHRYQSSCSTIVIFLYAGTLDVSEFPTNVTTDCLVIVSRSVGFHQTLKLHLSTTSTCFIRKVALQGFTWRDKHTPDYSMSCWWLKPFKIIQVLYQFISIYHLSPVYCLSPFYHRKEPATHMTQPWRYRMFLDTTDPPFGRKDSSRWCWRVDDPEYHTWEFWGKIRNWRLFGEARKILRAWVTWEHCGEKPKNYHPSSVI